MFHAYLIFFSLFFFIVNKKRIVIYERNGPFRAICRVSFFVQENTWRSYVFLHRMRVAYKRENHGKDGKRKSKRWRVRCIRAEGDVRIFLGNVKWHYAPARKVGYSWMRRPWFSFQFKRVSKICRKIGISDIHVKKKKKKKTRYNFFLLTVWKIREAYTNHLFWKCRKFKS